MAAKKPLCLYSGVPQEMPATDTIPEAMTLPAQTGNDGKVLTTDGSAASWKTASGGDDVLTWMAM